MSSGPSLLWFVLHLTPVGALQAHLRVQHSLGRSRVLPAKRICRASSGLLTRTTLARRHPRCFSYRTWWRSYGGIHRFAHLPSSSYPRVTEWTQQPKLHRLTRSTVLVFRQLHLQVSRIAQGLLGRLDPHLQFDRSFLRPLCNWIRRRRSLRGFPHL